MKNVYLISCTKSKQSYTCAAEEMYQPSKLFEASMSYALQRVESKNDRIHVLSAKHGLLYLTDVIDPYDESLIRKSEGELQIWGQKIIRILGMKHDIEDTNFIFLAPDNYIEPIVPYLKHYETPLTNLGIGMKISWLQNKSSRKAVYDERNITMRGGKGTVDEVRPLKFYMNPGENIHLSWEQICDKFETSVDIQTVMKDGSSNLWISVLRRGNELIVGPAVTKKPTSLIATRAIKQKDFEILYPLYQPWREGKITRSHITEISLNSSYIFAVIHDLLKANIDIQQQPSANITELKQMDKLIDGTNYVNYIVCKPSGYLLAAYGYDAYVLSELLGYKLLPDKNYFFKTGFPYSGINKVSEVLSRYRINHFFRSKDKVIINKEFEDNGYESFIDKFNLISEGSYIFQETKGYSSHIETPKGDSGVIALWSRFTIRDCKSNERITKTILPSYEIQEIKRHGGAYYGAGYESKIVSDANPVEGDTISDDAPLTKSLLGHKAGETIIHSRGNGEIDLYLIEEIENHGIIYKSLKDATCNAEAQKNDGYIHVKNDSHVAKEIIKLPESEKIERTAVGAHDRLEEEKNVAHIHKSNDELVRDAILTANSLIDIMLKLEIRDDITQHIKSLIDLRVFLEK